MFSSVWQQTSQDCQVISQVIYYNEPPWFVMFLTEYNRGLRAIGLSLSFQAAAFFYQEQIHLGLLCGLDYDSRDTTIVYEVQSFHMQLFNRLITISALW